jgi:WD40 repeat protein
VTHFPFRRLTLTWIVAAYVSSVGLLTWLVPHRPRLTIYVGEDSYLIGYSPDGSRLATASKSPYQAWLDGHPSKIAVWDFAGRWPLATMTRIADRSSERLDHLAWSWVNDPGRRWLFWQCTGADDCSARLRDLFPGVEVEPGDIDPTEETPRMRVSADGIYAAVRTDNGVYRVSERATGRTCVLTGPTRVSPAFGPSLYEVTVADGTGPPGQVSVGRWNLTTGKGESLAVITSLPMTTARPIASGRWLAATEQSGNVPGYLNLALFDAQTGRCSVSDQHLEDWRFIVPGDRLVTVHNDGIAGSPRIMFRDMVGGEITIPASRETRNVHVQLSASSPDGTILAVADSRAANWPWSWPKPAQQVYGWLRAMRGDDTGSLLLYDIESGETLARLPANTVNINPLTGEGVAAFSDDGRQLAVLGVGGLVRIWDWPLGRPWARILVLGAVLPLVGSFVLMGYRRLRGRPWHQ